VQPKQSPVGLFKDLPGLAEYLENDLSGAGAGVFRPTRPVSQMARMKAKKAEYPVK